MLIRRHTGCVGGPCGLSGTILLNGAPQPTIFKYTTDYVVQDDNVMEPLMEREHRVFSSPLAKMKSQARNEHINKIFEELDMSKVLNSSVENQLIRGVSRGARKKTPWQGRRLQTNPTVCLRMGPPLAEKLAH